MRSSDVRSRERNVHAIQDQFDWHSFPQRAGERYGHGIQDQLGWHEFLHDFSHEFSQGHRLDKPLPSSNRRTYLATTTTDGSMRDTYVQRILPVHNCCCMRVPCAQRTLPVHNCCFLCSALAQDDYRPCASFRAQQPLTLWSSTSFLIKGSQCPIASLPLE